MAFLPDYWWPTDEATVITQESSQLLRRKGSFSAHVQAPIAAFAGDPNALDANGLPVPVAGVVGSGIVSSPIPVRPTEFQPFYTLQISLWVIQGAVRLELWDVTDCANVIIWPPREADVRAVTTEIGNWVDNLAIAPGEDFFIGTTTGTTTTAFQIAVLADVIDTEFHLDAAMLTNTAGGVPTFVEGKASNLLIIAANDAFSVIGNPLSSYRLSAVDLNRKDATTWPSEDIEIGANARLKVDDILLDVSPRMTGLSKDLFEETKTSVTLETEEETLTRKLTETQRRRRSIQVSHPEFVNRPANVTGLSGAITN